MARKFAYFHVMIALACMTMSVVANAQSFEGKTIRVVQNTSAGGPADVLLRQLTPFIAKRIPGTPTLVIEHRVGAGGMIGTNYLFNMAPADGSTIGFLIGVVAQGMVGDEAAKYDPQKFRWLGALPQTQVLLVRRDLKISGAKDFLNQAASIVLAGAGTSNPVRLADLLFFEMSGIKYKYVTGYIGQVQSNLALARGEVNVDSAGLVAYISRRETLKAEGIIDALLQRGVIDASGAFGRHRQIPELPTMVEALSEIRPSALQTTEFAAFRVLVGAMNLQFSFVLPPKTSEPVAAVLSKAIADALIDPQTVEDTRQRLKMEYDFLDGAASQRMVERVRQDYSSDAGVPAVFRRLLSAK